MGSAAIGDGEGDGTGACVVRHGQEAAGRLDADAGGSILHAPTDQVVLQGKQFIFNEAMNKVLRCAGDGDSVFALDLQRGRKLQDL